MSVADIIKLLRIPFSIILSPIYFLAVYFTGIDHFEWKWILIFVVIHFIFYPASNAYNSYMDQDSGSIGGLKHPPKATRTLFFVSNGLDILGLMISALISNVFFLLNLLLVILSRAYSYRNIRLKKFAILGFLVVSISQGGISFINIYGGLNNIYKIQNLFSLETMTYALIPTLFVGAIYPITQIYQHEEDNMNGDTTLSMILGIRGSFLFSGLLFICSFILLSINMSVKSGLILAFSLIPSILFFIFWLIKSWNNPQNANFKNTMLFVFSSGVAMNLALILILLLG